jgi:hypothetical protein
VNTSILEEELAPLYAQIDKGRQDLDALEGELRQVEAELETFSDERQQYEALLDVCKALDRLKELEADELFWEKLPHAGDRAEPMEQLRTSISKFEDEISGTLEKEALLQDRIQQCENELGLLQEELHNAYEREERRKEEFIIEREISPVPDRKAIMPWTKDVESEKRFRQAVLTALVICFVFGAPIPLIKVPLPDRLDTEIKIPKRIAMLVKPEPPRPIDVPIPPPPKKKKKEPQKQDEKPKEVKKETKPKPKPEPQPKPVEKQPPKPVKVADKGGGTAAAKKKAQSVGVLAFKDAFEDLMKDTPVAKLGTEASLKNDNPQIKGRAMAQRSLVAIQAQGGTSGGIGNAGFSRNIGNGNADRLGGSGIGTGSGTGFAQVESSIGGGGESSRPLSDGLAAGRTDEEIQIVFDRYKATLYRIYNTELRKDPTLRGKILMRLTIEPDGSVSMCKAESTDLDSPVLVDKIVERIKRFNFGPKDDVQRITILYPIDFLPAV